MLSRISGKLRRLALFRFAELCTRRENRVVVATLAACAVFLGWKAAHLRYTDLVFGYPFVMFDSFQWMLDSLLYRGHDVDAVYRNPGLPLVLAVLGALGRMAWLPLVTVGLSALFAMYLALLLRRHFPPVPTAVALLLILFNFSLQAGFDYVLADQWAVTFQVAAVYHLLEAEEDPVHLRPFAAWSALSFLFQYAIAVLAPACLLYVFLVLRRRTGDARRFDRNLIGAAALALLITAPLFIYKTVRFGNPMHSGVVQAQLLKPHFFGVVFYAFNALAFYGLIAALVSAYGFVRGLRDEGAHLLVNACILSYFAFWVLLYMWLDSRFLFYFVPFAAFCLARGLTDLRLERWLGGRGAAAPQVAVGWAGLTFALLCGLYERSDPYSRSELPLTPQTQLVLGMRPITAWEGNVTISLDGMRLADTTEGLPALHFLRSYHRVRRAAVDPRSLSEGAELRRAREILPDGFRLAACGHLPQDYYARMRRELAFEHRLEPCRPDVPFQLVGANDPVDAPAEVLFSGDFYRVLRSNPLPAGGAGVREVQKR